MICMRKRVAVDVFNCPVQRVKSFLLIIVTDNKHVRIFLIGENFHQKRGLVKSAVEAVICQDVSNLEDRAAWCPA